MDKQVVLMYLVLWPVAIQALGVLVQTLKA